MSEHRKKRQFENREKHTKVNLITLMINVTSQKLLRYF